MESSIIDIADLRKTYQMGEVEVHALQGVSFSIPRGEFVAIMGPSGSGKSTLMNVLGCLDVPTSGSYKLDGIEVEQFNERKRADLRKRNIGFVFQSFNLIDELTVFENVELPLIYLGIKSAERKQRVEAVLDKMQIMHRRNHYPQQLSGGQQQRVAIARALAGSPSVLLADEPTGALDTKTSEEIMSILQRLNREQGLTVILVTHEPDVAAYAQRILTVRDGLLVSDGPPVHRTLAA